MKTLYMYRGDACAAALALSIKHTDIQFKVVQTTNPDQMRDMFDAYRYFVGEPAAPRFTNPMLAGLNDIVKYTYWNGRKFAPDEHLSSTNARII
jgi:hypothetical protein